MGLCLLVGSIMGILGGAVFGAALGYVLAWTDPPDIRGEAMSFHASFAAGPGLPVGAVASLVYGMVGGWRGALLSGLTAGVFNPLFWIFVVRPTVEGGPPIDALGYTAGLMPFLLGTIIALALDALYRHLMERTH